MPWTTDNPPSVAKNWTDDEKGKCVTAANAVLSDDGDDETAIFACINAAGKGKKLASKAVSLDEQGRRVRDAWYASFKPPRDMAQPSTSGDYWVKEVFEDSIILEGPEGLFSYPYTITDDGIEFSEPIKVEIEYKPVESKAIQSNCLKAISVEGDEMRVANHIILFGGRDLEGLASKKINADGSKGEYFTAKTVLDSAFTETGRLLVDWEHGLTKGVMDGDDLAAPGRDDILGYVDWATAKATEQGLWVERVLNLRNKYMMFLKHLIEAGKIGTSSEAIDDGVQKAADGRIVTFPLRRDTLTVKPMEWRMMLSNPLLAKAIGGLLELSEIATEAVVPEDDGKSSAEADAEVARARLAAIKAAIQIGLLELEIMEV